MTFDPDWRVAPGETIQDIMDEKGVTESMLISRTGLHPAQVRALLDGTANLTPEIADRLWSAGIGPSPKFWLAMEAQYRKPITRKET